MCLISVLPKGKEKFNDKVIAFIRKGAASNTQGSGFMFKRNGEDKITIDKGYFDVNKLIEKLESYNLGVEDELVIHHRISTSGRVSAENSHPFVISDREEVVSSIDITTSLPCMAHNGMFSKLNHFMSINPDFSDTYAFARYVMSNRNIMALYNEDKVLFSTVLGEVISGSRIAILFPDKDLETIGTFVDDDGYKHSNTGYCTFNRNYGGYDNYDYGYYGAYAARRQEQLRFATPALPAPTTVRHKFDSNSEHYYCVHTNRLEKLVLLDSNSVKSIGSNNYDHFYFIEKRIYDKDKDLEGDLETGILTSYNPRTLNYYALNLEFRDENNIRSFSSVTYRELMEDYYFIPKDEYSDMYSDYLKLIQSLKRYPASKTAIKNVQKKIDENGTKPIDYKVRCSRLGKFAAVRKDALSMFLERLKLDVAVSDRVGLVYDSVEESETNRILGSV